MLDESINYSALNLAYERISGEALHGALISYAFDEVCQLELSGFIHDKCYINSISNFKVELTTITMI